MNTDQEADLITLAYQYGSERATQARFLADIIHIAEETQDWCYAMSIPDDLLIQVAVAITRGWTVQELRQQLAQKVRSGPWEST